MKTKKLITVITLLLSLAMIFASCSQNSGKDNTTSPAVPENTNAADTTAAPGAETVRIGMLKGPTGMGASYLIEQNNEGKTRAKYEVTLAASPDVFTSALLNKELDIAALPVNVCAVLNAKSEGKVQILAVNTLGTMYIMTNDASVKTVSDLKGKTVLSAGQGTTTEYVLNHILTENGLTLGTDVKVEYASEHAEVITRASSENYSVILLPEPFVTQMKLADKGFEVALDLTKEWKALGGGELTMGAVAVRTEFAENNPEAVSQFLADYKESVDFVNSNTEEASALIEKQEIVAKAAIAKQAIPNCNITLITGEEMKTNVSAYLQVLFDTEPASVGGVMPSDSFYYIAK